MGFALTICILIVGASIVYAVYREYARGVGELASFRNLAILGFLYFQIWAAVHPFTTGNTLMYRVDNLIGSAFTYVGMAIVFSLVFWFVYKQGWGIPRLAKLVPTSKIQPSESMLWAIAFALVPVAVLFRFSVEVPLIGVLTMYCANSLAALSAGIGGWIWARRLYNPLVACVATCLFLVNSFIVMIGEFGRRPLVGIALCVLWGMYFSTWRYQRLSKWLPRLVVFGSIGLIAMITFSSVRAQRGVTESFGNLLNAVTQSSDVAGAGVGMIFPDTGPVSLWLIDSHPGTFEHRHLFTLYYTFLNPVPRQWWTEKPRPLGTEITRMAGIRNVSDEMSLGPGIIGHAASEGGWYALVIYAICGALLLKFFDTLALRNLSNPLIMLPLGSTLGQVVAMPRGETSLFVFIFVYGTATTYAGMLLLLWGAQFVGIRAEELPSEASDAGEEPLADSTAQHDDSAEEWYGEYGQYDDRSITPIR